MNRAQLIALTLYDAPAECNCECTRSVIYTFSALHANQVCKFCTFRTAISYRGWKLSLLPHMEQYYCEPPVNYVRQRCTPVMKSCCNPQLLLTEIPYWGEELRAWHIAVLKNCRLKQFPAPQYAKPTTYRASSD